MTAKWTIDPKHCDCWIPETSDNIDPELLAGIRKEHKGWDFDGIVRDNTTSPISSADCLVKKDDSLFFIEFKHNILDGMGEVRPEIMCGIHKKAKDTAMIAERFLPESITEGVRRRYFILVGDEKKWARMNTYVLTKDVPLIQSMTMYQTPDTHNNRVYFDRVFAIHALGFSRWVNDGCRIHKLDEEMKARKELIRAKRVA
ncbi:MAG: hypothetical protein Q4Q58_06985 [Thermoplasmata archaeon]|nr:hypothetical protein [Thermoplasmata archaeon]